MPLHNFKVLYRLAIPVLFAIAIPFFIEVNYCYYNQFILLWRKHNAHMLFIMSNALKWIGRASVIGLYFLCIQLSFLQNFEHFSFIDMPARNIEAAVGAEEWPSGTHV